MRGTLLRKIFKPMFRINLIKLFTLISFFLTLPVLALVDTPKQIIAEDGKPIPHAIIQVGGAGPVLVDKEGKVTANLPEGESILIFALGYDSLQISREDWLAKEIFILKEKSGSLQEVVVAATRTDRTVEDLPLPVTVLNEKAIQETGGIRLSEILQEQTGLQISGDHGAGLQMQGLDSDYILILLDGEPLIGRTAGTFDLDRISVSNIERIEILRGPSSAIYGSEAMAGVVNIITKSTEEETRLDLGLRHRSFNSWNPYADLGFSKGKWSTKLFYDYMSTEGYDLTPEIAGQTQNPYQAQTFQLKINGKIHSKWDVSLFGRGYLENSTGELETSASSGSELLNLDNTRRDFNFNPTLRFTPNSKILMTLRSMSSWFSTVADTRFSADGGIFDFQDFNQLYHRTELQTDFQVKQNQLLTVGLGHLVETVEATRYEGKNRFDAGYLFLQHQWDPGKKTNIISGLRADFHSQYGNRFSPKISGQYRPTKNFSWQASVGAGFKAPDFRQLLLNFNNAAAGYYVFGSTLAQEGVEKLQNEGLIARILLDPSTLGALKAESSWALNTGFRWKVNPNLLWVGNAYRNHINDLIETAPIAQLVTGQNTFSYFNIAQVVTQGIETDLSFQATNNLQLSLGYAFLDTQDADVLDQIEAGELFKRDDQNRTTRVVRSDYGGLFNRSRHSGNIKINYQDQWSGVDFALRAIYRGKFGFADLNGNLILDDESEYAPGWISVNLTASKTLKNGIFLEAGGTNLFNTQTQFQPANPGRVLFAGVKIPFANLIQTK